MKCTEALFIQDQLIFNEPFYHPGTSETKVNGFLFSMATKGMSLTTLRLLLLQREIYAWIF